MRCPFCEKEAPPETRYCYHCGAEMGDGSTEEIYSAPDLLSDAKSTGPSEGFLSAPDKPSFVSGNAIADLEKVKGWNWGAFAFTWIWAFANGLTQLGVIALVLGFFGGSIGGLGASIWLGMTGNEQLWKTKHFASVEQFKEGQKKWAIFGMIWLAFTTMLLVFVLIIHFGNS